MAVNEYDKGDQIKIVGTFTNAAGELVDPTSVFFSYRTPNGDITVWEYTVDADVVRSSAGIYYVLLDLDSEVGEWYYRWYSTGTGKAAKRHKFIVKPAFF